MTALLSTEAPQPFMPARPSKAELRAAPSLAAAVRDLDSRRARSRQRMIGASELGECRRRAAYRIARTKPSNSSTGLQAALGTAIHKDVLRALVKMYGGISEVKVRGEQVKGSMDWLDTAEDAPVVEDLKTTSKGGYEKVLTRGPYRKHWFQVITYAWLARIGAVVDRRLLKVGTDSVDVAGVRIRYLSRDSGEDTTFVEPYDPFLAAEAIAWLSDVYGALEDVGGDPDETPRDGFGPGIDSMCDYCPFLDRCWGPPVEAGSSRQSRLTVTDEDYTAAVSDYDKWRTAKSEATRQLEYARERLRGRTGPAGDLHCAWSGGNARYTVDKEACVERLLELGENLPTKETTSPISIRVTRNVAAPEAATESVVLE